MFNDSEDSKIEQMFEDLSVHKDRFIYPNYEKYITGLRKNKRRREDVSPKKEKRKRL